MESDLEAGKLPLAPAGVGGYPLEEISTARSDYHEAKLRLHHIRVEYNLGVRSVFSNEFFGETIPRSQVACLPTATSRINDGLTIVRFQDCRAEGTLRSLILEPTADGSFYVQYRSNLHSHLGRLERLQCFGPDGQVRPDWVRTAFESAYGQFDLARGGLGGTNRLLAAVNEMAAVEANLANGRIVLHPKYDWKKGHMGEGPRPEPLALAFSKYESARSALQRSRDALFGGVESMWNVLKEEDHGRLFLRCGEQTTGINPLMIRLNLLEHAARLASTK
jgi:hypothetical protein